MSFQYQNPTSDVVLNGPDSVSLDNNTGTNFSVYSIGGYMEVYSISDLDFVIPPGDSGTILYSGNTIPINYQYGTPLSAPNAVTVNNDQISCGRRRLGMSVYVVEVDTVFQYVIDGYSALWNAAEISGSLVPVGGGYQCYDDTGAGANFVNAWFDSSVEGVSGATHATARWKIFYGTDWQITGGTYNSGTTTLDLFNNTGGTLSITGFTGTVTRGTYDSGTSTLTLTFIF